MICWLMMVFVLLMTACSASTLPDIELITQMMGRTKLDHRIQDYPIQQPIQVLDLLAQELNHPSQPLQQERIAKTLIALGTSRYQGNYPIPTNHQEEKILRQALGQAAAFLKEKNLLSESDMTRFIESFLPESEKKDADYRELVRSILMGSYKKGGQTLSLSLAPPLPGQNSLVGLSTFLAETSNPQHAYRSAMALQDILQNKTDFSVLLEERSEGALYNTLVPALIRLEKYRLFETEHGSLKTLSPTVFDYKTSQQTPQSHAVLFSLVSAIHNAFSNPRTTPEDFLRLLKYQKNSRLLPEAVRTALGNMLHEPRFNNLIDSGLLLMVQQTILGIASLQRRALEQQSQKQSLLSYNFPQLFPETCQQELQPFSVRHFGSSGVGAQCGFFSLNFESRQAAIEQILDNLIEPEIYTLANMITSEGARIRSMMMNYLQTNTPSPEFKPYFTLYAKNHGLNVSDPDFWLKLKEDYCHLASQIAENERKIDDEFDTLKQFHNLPITVPSDDDGTIANQFAILRQPFEQRKWEEQAKITRFFYPMADFQSFLQQVIQQKFRGGELEFDPNPDWMVDTINFPKLLAILNHYDIYAWVSSLTFQNMQRQRGAAVTTPIHTTEDGKYVLVHFAHGGLNAKPMDIINMSGGHFEKWVRCDDWVRLAQALRHKNKYSLPR